MYWSCDSAPVLLSRLNRPSWLGAELLFVVVVSDPFGGEPTSPLCTISPFKDILSSSSIKSRVSFFFWTFFASFRSNSSIDDEVGL